MLRTSFADLRARFFVRPASERHTTSHDQTSFAVLEREGFAARLFHSRLSLLSRFSLVSFILLLILGAGLAGGLQWQIEQSALRQASDSAGDQVKLVLEPNLKAVDFHYPLSAARYSEIDNLVHKYVLNEHIARVKLWNKDGVVAYSDDPLLAGRRFPIEDDLAVALEGRQHMAVSNLDADENVQERQHFSRLMEIYIPFVPTGASKPVGVYEIYHDLDAVQDRVTEGRNFVWSSLGLGLLLLYSSLFTVVRNASRKLVTQSQDNMRLYNDAQQQLAERIEAQQQVQLQLERLAALRSIDMAISSSPDLRLSMEVVLDKVTGQLGVDAAHIMLLNQHTQVLYYAAGRGFMTGSITRSQIKLGQGHAGRAALKRITLNIPDLRNTGELLRLRFLDGEGFVAYYVVPLIAKGNVEGVLEVFHRSPMSPNSAWMDFLEALAGQAAIAIDNATMFNDLQRSNTELALAYDVTLEG
ncbi:MAG: GAF domain-containing protein, partial [Chloroflexota bacterium]|nr:GAF domain-containing protein [Chloroflexota bacterium]